MINYQVWAGRKVQNNDTKEIFIETNDSDWHHRLSVWKTLCYKDPLCPRPMPKGHVMFLNYGKSSNYIPIKEA
jgi:hypothetical protein